jgi:hypothetical protein
MEMNRKKAMRLATNLAMMLAKKEQDHEARRVLNYLTEISAVLNLHGLANETALCSAAA